MRAREVVFSLCLGMMTLTGAGVAYAEPPGPNALPVHVLAIKTDDADDQAEALTAALKAEVRKLPGWSLGEGDFALEVLSLALKCPSPPDAACEQRMADQIKTDRFIWGTLKKAPGKRVVGTLHMWTRGQGQTKYELSFSDNLLVPDDDALRKVAQDALAALTGGPPKGSVKIQAGTVNGQVFVDGQPSGAIKDGQATIFVPVGTHRVEVRAPGYAVTSGEVSVKPNSSSTLSLNPVAEEGARRPGTPTSGRKIAAYSSFAAGGVFALAGLYSSLKVNSISNDAGFANYRAGVRDDVCDAAKRGDKARDAKGTELPGAADPSRVSDLCSTAGTFQVLQFVFYGLGAVGVGVGTYLLTTDKKGKEAPPAVGKFQLYPSAVPGQGGRLDVRVIF